MGSQSLVLSVSGVEDGGREGRVQSLCFGEGAEGVKVKELEVSSALQIFSL